MADLNLNNLSQLESVIAEKRHNVFVGHNLGNSTLLLPIKLHEFYEISAVANDPDMGDVTQRQLDPKHSRGLATYILKGLVASALKKQQTDTVRESLEQIQTTLGHQVYLCLQPIVTNLRLPPGREAPRLEPIIDKATGASTAVAVYLRTDDLLWVIDGQHRREAMHELFEFLSTLLRTRRYPKKSLFEADFPELTVSDLAAWEAVLKEARGHCTVMVEVHFGLTADQERQLFHDLNSKVKKVQASLSLEFDTANPIVMFIKRDLKEIGVRIASDTDKVDFDDADNGCFSMKELVAVNAHLFLNKTNVNGVTQNVFNERVELAREFWTAVTKIPNFGVKNAKHLTVASQPVMLKALAKLVFDFSDWGRQKNPEALARLLMAITNEIDFSHGSQMWRYYELSSEKRSQNALTSLSEYLPSGAGGNRDVGAFSVDEGWMRFGAKHNDIFPILADMIRWKLKLPSRQSQGTSTSAAA
jgi:hypothetical protein